MTTSAVWSASQKRQTSLAGPGITTTTNVDMHNIIRLERSFPPALR